MAFAFYLPELVKRNPLKRSFSMPLMPDDLSRIGKGVIAPVEANIDDVPRGRNTGFLDIDEKVEDVLLFEGETALFECKVVQDFKPTCTWYKDGHPLEPDDERISIIKNSAWHRLEIKGVTFNAQGIYTIECWHKYQYIVIKGHLYVVPRIINDSAFYHKIKHTGAGVIKHLMNVKVYKTETVYLEATFGFTSDEYIWYKNNDVIQQDQRTSMKKSEGTASLTITNAQPTDVGVYYVVALTEQGYLSSCADVQVGDYNEIRPVFPILEEYLPDDMNGFVGEELRMVLKVHLDKDTTIKWYKGGLEIQNPDYLKVDYGNYYFGLNLLCTEMSSVGNYTVYFMNSVMHQVVSASTHVKVKHALPRVPEVDLIRPLSSAVACCGAMVSFDCRFDIIDPLYFYVVWYVGPYKVERSNSIFKVMSDGGQYVLYIKKVERAMAGDIVCELRRAWPTRKSVMLQRAYARLVVVPLAVVQEARTRPVDDSKLHFQQNADNDKITVEDMDGDYTVDADEPADYVLKIVYCRLDDDGLFFVHAVRGNESTKPISLKIKEHKRADQTSMMMHWADSNTMNHWYVIEMAQCNGAFVELGLTSRPAFAIEYPSLHRLMVFRIRAVAENPTSGVFDMQVFVALPLEVIPRQPPPLEIETIDSFNSRYSETKHTVGAGAFGVVSLVKDKVTGAHYAAKFVKGVVVNKREHIMREFLIMQNLHHPKIINLLGFFESRVTYIFVMEFCWGGELFDRMIKEEYLMEVDVVGYIKQICEALQYLHKKAIVHLDLKPENIMCISPESLQVKLIDFGLAREVKEDGCRAVYGTRDYVAPEVVEYEPITTNTDMWTLGVVTFLLLSGLMPFRGQNWIDRAFNIAKARYDFNDYSFTDVSDVAKDFVSHLIVRKPDERMTAAQALQHKWILEGPIGKKPKRLTLMRLNLRSYLADYRSRWQRAGNLMVSAHRYRTSSENGTPDSLSEAGASGSSQETHARTNSPELPFDVDFDDLML